ncbi:hypothetical protein HZS61_007293 [Fusarium oxysporum f. sp. conglutinans]|uniref:C3H1-type domain-containing protein n=1 Tax=Fusarium oxysporum f. sp. conglutinans TaxID=100902 RepID=A0A8H6LBG0_FUSOX|nr:hypothetical protein HZS61_007293 [Fusarium oxysporum f. sp. conglutinans]
MLPDETIDRAADTLAKFRNNNALNDILDQYAVLIEDYKRLKSDYEEEREGRERLRRKGLESCEVMVRMYANLTGLSKTLCKSGLSGAEKRSFSSFAAGFNHSYGLADFIDAGELKENADFKLKAILRLYAENAQCKHIYFAACHDVGYVSDLIPFRGNRERFTLIRTPSLLFHKEFDRLGMNVEELPGVFRYVPLTYAYSTPQSKTSVTNISTSSKGNAVCSLYMRGNCRYGSGCRFSHGDSKTSSQNSTPSPPTVGTSTKNFASDWRHGSTHAANSNIECLPRKEDITDGFVAINADEDRLDAYLPALDPEANSSPPLNISRALSHVTAAENVAEQTAFMDMFAKELIVAIASVGKVIVVSSSGFVTQIIRLGTLCLLAIHR